ncbi:MAG: DEAD/DEAH box helicase [Firmicutes bacterium]|nr:DEAD/DEAH box helicase [Bacillota bacterium]
MINNIIELTSDKLLTATFESLADVKGNTTVYTSDSSLAPLLGSAVTEPLVFVTPSVDSVHDSVTVFTNMGRTAIGVTVIPDMPIYMDGKKESVNSNLESGIRKFLGGSADVLVMPANALLTRVPMIGASTTTLAVGKKYNMRDIITTLDGYGFSRTHTVTVPNDFSLKGDVIDVWLGGDKHPIRIMFFGDEIEAIKRVNAFDFATVEKLQTLTVTPISQLGDISREKVREKLETVDKSHENMRAIINSLMTRVVKGDDINSVRWLSALLCSFANPLSLMPEGVTVVFDRPREICDILKETQKQNTTRITSLIDGGLLLPQHAEMFGTAGEVTRDIIGRVCVGFSTMNQGHDLFACTNELHLKTLPVTSYYSALSAMTPDMLRFAESGKTVLVFVDGAACENYLKSKSVPFNRITGDTKPMAGQINIVYMPLGPSFELPNSKTVVFSVKPPPRIEAHVEAPEPTHEDAPVVKTKFVMPTVGEVVVHEVHGLGRYVGMKELEISEKMVEYFVLQYDGGSLVYVPHEMMHLLSNYHGEPARLNRIGGQDFTRVKQRVRRRLKDLSAELAKLYSRRLRVKSNTYHVEDAIMAEFRDAFTHTLTPDQEKSLRDIAADMTGDKVMDRLVCGDVGFGKTEVALHAAFRAIMGGFQVALLCPTTILSVQHYNTAKKRLGKFGVEVEVINRFRSDKEVADILERVGSGQVDILVGTHRLLSGDVRFKNLALLILDEEQRFGVAHKEKIKQIKSSIDVLTLSATPIPRTLNMALIGIRDISNIQTPPVNRRPIVTYVTEYSDGLMVDAIEREQARGGQVLVLFNNVEKIEGFAATLRRLCKDGTRVATIHGQMPSTQIENTIIAMYNREIDVLVTSTIIENGIDIPTANTLIVINADKLGVAQMHQIRGRVGRSTTQAFAYFTYSPNKEVSEIARERLLAIQTHAGHGSGLNIAMRDLQIRGAGDLLGGEQSGHIDTVGFDIYMRILTEVAGEMKNGR